MPYLRKLVDGATKGRSATNKTNSLSVSYLVIQANSEDEALDFVYKQAPHIENGLHYNGTSLSKTGSDGSYEINVNYVQKKLNDSGNVNLFPKKQKARISMSTTVITVNRKQSLGRLFSEEDTPTHITDTVNVNQNSDGEVQGAQVITGCLKFTLTYFFNVSTLSASFQKFLGNSIGFVNETAFRGYPAGELLFNGASGSWVEDQSEQVPITFNFSVSCNSSVGELLTIEKLTEMALDKKDFDKLNKEVSGWDYKWFYKQPKEDQPNDKVIDIDSFLQVDKWYPRLDFKKFKIGR